MDIGKIYKISGYGLNYYGSTTESIKRRLQRHKSHYQEYLEGIRPDRITAFNIFELGDDYTIELIEHFLCDSKAQLLEREKFYITTNECINKNIPNRTEEEKKQRQKDYDSKHKEQRRETAKKWAENKRRELGIKLRSEMNETKNPDYFNKRSRDKRANETPEEKEERLKLRREKYKQNPLSEEQKERARERARKQREKA